MQEDVTRFPSKRGETWQTRLDRVLRIYNTDRGHESLGMRRPCELYRPSRRRCHGPVQPRQYPRHWIRRRLNAKGYPWWGKRARLIGAAFATQYLGLRPTEPGQCEVYCNDLFIGLLVATDRAGMRPIQQQSARD